MAWENIAGSAGTGYGMRDERLRQSMAANLRKAQETGKPYSVCQVCKKIKTRYSVLMWLWAASFGSVEELYHQRNKADDGKLWDEDLPHSQALEKQPCNRIKAGAIRCGM